MYKCKVCSKEFELKKEFHYISRDVKITTGLVNVVKKEEVKIFDTFDCPHCGCQNVMQERKRVDKSNVIVGLPIEEDFKRVENMSHEKREELKEQDCFGYYQEYIDKCRKCSEKDKCKQRKESTQVKETCLSKTNEKFIKCLPDDDVKENLPSCFGDCNRITDACSSKTCELYKECSEKVCKPNNECEDGLEREEDEL